MNAIWALARKDLKLLVRDRAGFFFTFIFPILFALFFGMIFGGSGGGGGGGGGSGIKVALVDGDKSEESRAFIKTLSDASELRAHTVDDLNVAEGEVTRSEVVALIHVKPGFGAGQQNLFWRGGDASTIEVSADPSKKAEVGMLEGVLQKYAFAGMGKAFTDPKVSRRQINSARKQLSESKDLNAADRLMFGTFFNSMDTFMGGLDERSAREAAKPAGEKKGTAESGGFAFEPVKIVKRDLSRNKENPPNAWTISFPQGIIWGVMSAALGFAASLVGEKTGGTFGRLAASPLPHWGVLGGKALACFITMVLVTSAMIGVAIALCGVTVGNWPVLSVAIVCVSLCFVGMMSLIACIAKTERAAQGYGWAFMMPLAMLGGAAMPSFVMPEFLQKLAQVSPMYWSMRLVEGGLWRDLSRDGAMASIVYVPVAVTLSVAAVGFGLGVLSMRRA